MLPRRHGASGLRDPGQGRVLRLDRAHAAAIPLPPAGPRREGPARSQTGKLQACISAISYNTVYYIVRKWGGKEQAESALRLLRDVFTTVDLTEKILLQAMDARLQDFEDAIQYFSAVHSGADVILTRNAEDFPRAGPTAMMPGEWLALLSAR